LPSGGTSTRSGLDGLARKFLHALGQPPDREDQHAIDGEEDQRRGDQRDGDRQEEDVARIDEHGRAQLGVLHHQLDRRIAFAQRAIDAHHPVAAEDERVEGVPDRAESREVGYVVFAVDRGGHVDAGDHPGGILAADDDGLRPGRHQRLALHGAGQLDILKSVDHDGRRRHGVQAVLQPANAHIGDGRHEDQHFGQHHEGDRQQQQFAGKPAKKADRRSGCRTRIGRTRVFYHKDFPGSR
jgi:hypothetical protein